MVAGRPEGLAPTSDESATTPQASIDAIPALQVFLQAALAMVSVDEAVLASARPEALTAAESS